MELSISSEPPSSNLARNIISDFEKSSRWQEWKDWRWQLKNRITTLEELKTFILLTPSEEEGVKRSGGRLAMAITPYFFSLIDKTNPNCPIRKQAIPRIEEFSISTHDMVDPCSEDNHSPVPVLCTDILTGCCFLLLIHAQCTAATAQGGAWLVRNILPFL